MEIFPSVYQNCIRSLLGTISSIFLQYRENETHSRVQITHDGNIIKTIFFNFNQIIALFQVDIVELSTVVLLSILLTLAVEMPFQNIKKVLFEKGMIFMLT